MTLRTAFGVTLAASLLSAGAALAGGPSPVDVTPAPAVAPAPKPTMTFGFEITPEFYASSKAGSYSAGDLADNVAKLSVSKALSNGVNVSGALSTVVREPGTTGVASTYSALELGASYKFKLTPNFSISPSATLGYAFGNQPKIDAAKPSDAVAYYAVGLAADLKIADGLTWNVVNLRYRNAFGTTWITPKLSTGVTYALDSTNSVYANIGKSWKDSGSGYKNDKYAIAFGLKHSF